MLRTCLIQSRIIANGTPLYGPRLCIAGKALHNKAPPPSNLGSSPPINPPHDLQFPNSFVELVEFARSVEKARKMAVDENGSNFEPNKGKGKGKKKKKKSQAKGDKSESECMLAPLNDVCTCCYQYTLRAEEQKRTRGRKRAYRDRTY
ncbi:hypothetical protein V565_120380 [Rhizoctonia solani 123E]|uniref:Uncharacterized protein n=1 Tax=Rhizoctonia solani 123E TaxID=1423351 RepID=A0A074RTE8_9AGAM|nr:hypothetical protein V565_120380 [Rhizoctonia solani 123E]